MADVDTEDKRRAVQAMTLGLMRSNPDNDFTARDRATAAWVYLIADVAATTPGHARIAFKPIWLRGTN